MNLFKDENVERAAEVSDAVTIPLLEEQLVIGKRLVETGKVRLTKHAEERTETVEVPLVNVHWQVERVLLDRVVSEVPAVRVEGDTTVYPVMEERLVVLRELVLREEVRVTRTTMTAIEQSSHTVRREIVTEERFHPTDDMPPTR